MFKPALATVACLVNLTGCSTIDQHIKVDGWPVLEVVEHHVSHKEMRDRCAKYVGPFSSPEACAEFGFKAKRCDIWLSADYPPSQSVIEHERLHCMGYDHPGEHGMQRMLKAT